MSSLQDYSNIVKKPLESFQFKYKGTVISNACKKKTIAEIGFNDSTVITTHTDEAYIEKYKKFSVNIRVSRGS